VIRELDSTKPRSKLVDFNLLSDEEKEMLA
jgi:hypothetical protein